MLNGYSMLEFLLKGGLLDVLNPIAQADVISAIIEYSSNLKNDIVGNSISDIRNDQNDREGPIAKLMYGVSSFNINGCEVIAVYNSLLELGYRNVSMAGLILLHRLVDADVALGAWGTSPTKMGCVLDILGIENSTISSIEDMKEDGVYILSFWTGSDLDSSIHTIAVRNNDGVYSMHNFAQATRDPITNDPLYYTYSDNADFLRTLDIFYGYRVY